MIVLGIETATNNTGVALASGDRVLSSFQLSHRRLHAETLVPAIAFVCEQARVQLSDIDVLAVDQGPGLFTGLRVGVATAKALAYALGKPMIGFCSLDVLAFGAALFEGTIICVLDALKGEVFLASFVSDGHAVRRISAPRVTSPTEAAASLSGRSGRFLLLGDGATRYSEIFCQALPTAEIGDRLLELPSPVSLVCLAGKAIAAGGLASESEIQPMYLREPYIYPQPTERT